MNEKQIYEELMMAGCNIKNSLLYLELKHEQMKRKYGVESETVKQFKQVIVNLDRFSRAWDKQQLEIRVLTKANNKRKADIISMRQDIKDKDEMIERLMKGI